MIYYMSTKTLVKEFTKEHSPKQILDCDFISFSQRVSACPYQLSYSERIFFGLERDKDDINIKLVKKHILNSFDDLELIIRMITNSVVEPNKLFVLLSSPKEVKTRYPYFFAKAIEDIFHYPIIDYKNDKHKDFYYDPTLVVNISAYYNAEVQLHLIGLDAFEKLKTKTMKKLFKAVGIYEKGMDREEMIDIYITKYSLPFKIRGR